MSVPWHHYTHALHNLLGYSPDLTVTVADGQVLCHKPVLACHSPFLKNTLLHPDTDSILMPDFRKEDWTHLVSVLYGRVPQASVSAQLLEVLGIAMLSPIREQSFLGRPLPPKSTHTDVRDNHVKAHEREETEKNYLCHNCSAFFSSQSRLYAHIETCSDGLEGNTKEFCDDGHEGDTGDIIYQCSLCSLVCSDLEELHNHMDVHSNEGFADEDVIFMDERLKHSKEMKIKTQDDVQVEIISADLVEEVITEELDEHEFLIADEEVEVQDPSIETTEVTVSSDEEIRQDLAVTSNVHSNQVGVQKEIINDGDLTEPQIIQEMLHTQRIIEDESEFTAIPKVFCQFCEDNFDSINDLNVHTINFHFELFQSLHMTVGDHYHDGILNDENEDATQEANQEQNLFYRCTLCENSFDTTKALLQHVSSNHETKPQNVLPVSCVHCSRSFTKRTFLAKHYRVAHRGLQQIFQCPECGKILKAAKTLENHELLHTGLKPFQCGLCQMKFYSGCSLRAHVRKGCGQARNANQNIPLEVHSRPIVPELGGSNNMKSTKTEIKPVIQETAVSLDQSQFNENDYEEMVVDNDSSNSSDQRLFEDRRKKIVSGSITVAMDLEEFKNGVLMQGTEGDDEQCCNVCLYKTRRKNDFKRHLETRRHKENHEKYMEEIESEPQMEGTAKEKLSEITVGVVDGKTEKVSNINVSCVSSDGNNSKLIHKTLAAGDVVLEVESSIDHRNPETMMLPSEYDVQIVGEDDNLQREVITEHPSVCESSSNTFTESVMIADFVFAEDDQVLIVDDGVLEKKTEDSENKNEEIIIEDKNSDVTTQSESSENVSMDTGVHADLIKAEDISKDYDLDKEAKPKEVPVPREMTVNAEIISDLGEIIENIGDFNDSESAMDNVGTLEKFEIKLGGNDASHAVCICSEQGDKMLNDKDTYCEIEGSAMDNNFERTEGFQSIEAEDIVDKDVGTSIFREPKEPENNSSNDVESFSNQSTEYQPTDCHSESSVKVDFVETRTPENDVDETLINQTEESQSTAEFVSISKETKKLDNNSSNVDGTFVKQSTKFDNDPAVKELIREIPVNLDSLNFDNNDSVKDSITDENFIEMSCQTEKIKGLKDKIGKLKEKSKMKRNIKLDSTCKSDCTESKVDESIKPNENTKAEQETPIVNIDKEDTHSDIESSGIILGEDPKSIERTDDGIMEEPIRIEKAQKVGDLGAFDSVDIVVAEDLENKETTKLASKDSKHDNHYTENNDIKTVSADKKKQYREKISELKAKAENLKRKREYEKKTTSHFDSKKFKANDNCTKIVEYARIESETATFGNIKESAVNIDSDDARIQADILEGSNTADEDESTEKTRRCKSKRIKDKKKSNDSKDSPTISSEHPSSNASRIEKLRKLKAKLGVIKARSEFKIVDTINIHTESHNKVEQQNSIESIDDEIAFNCDLCQEYFKSRQKLFVHMMTHVPDGIRANLPEGEHGWCPQCPGPVPVHQVNAHVAECHPELEMGEIPSDADPLEVLEDGFEPAEMRQDEGNTDGSGIQDLTAKCLDVSVKLIPVNLAEYGVNVEDYM